MVDTALVFTAETDVECGDAVVLQESSVVGTRAERRNAEIGALANFFALLRRFGIGNFVELLALPRAQFGFRVGNIARDIVAEFFERMRAFDSEITAAIAV